MSEDQLRAWIREELVWLWHDLRREERLSLAPRTSNTWSLAQESVGERIKAATALVGPVDWRNIPVPLLLSGWFVHMNIRLNIIDPQLPTDQELAEAEKRHRRLVGDQP